MARAIRTVSPASPGPEPPEASPTAGADLATTTDAVREFLEILRGLEDRGFLRFANDLLRSEDRIVQVLTERVDPGGVRRAVQGARTLLAAIGEVDPRLVAQVSERITPGLEGALRAEPGPRIGVVEVVSALNDPEVNRGLRMLLGFLRGVGRAPPE